MREVHRRDGSIALFGDFDDRDELIAVATIREFRPTRNGARCLCGTTLELRAASEGHEVYCPGCHYVHAYLNLAINTYRRAVVLQRTDFFTGLPRHYFRAILIDVPLRYKTWSVKGEGRSASRHYRVMTFEESKTLPVGELAADDAWLFSWIPGPFIPRIGEQMEAWDFEYSSKAFCWVKLNKKSSTPFMGQGHTTRKGTEDCFLGRRGSPRRNSASVRELIIAPMREHSRKPDEIYKRIEQFCDGPFLEIFARTQRPGWTAWGDQVGLFDEVTS